MIITTTLALHFVLKLVQEKMCDQESDDSDWFEYPADPLWSRIRDYFFPEPPAPAIPPPLDPDMEEDWSYSDDDHENQNYMYMSRDQSEGEAYLYELEHYWEYPVRWFY